MRNRSSNYNPPPTQTSARTSQAQRGRPEKYATFAEKQNLFNLIHAVQNLVYLAQNSSRCTSHIQHINRMASGTNTQQDPNIWEAYPQGAIRMRGQTEEVGDAILHDTNLIIHNINTYTPQIRRNVYYSYMSRMVNYYTQFIPLLTDGISTEIANVVYAEEAVRQAFSNSEHLSRLPRIDYRSMGERAGTASDRHTRNELNRTS
jgi:hypothetical protein